MTTTRTTDGTTTQGLTHDVQEKIYQLAMQYLVEDPAKTMLNPRYLYSQVGNPQHSRSFLRLPDRCWYLFFKVDVPIGLLSSDHVIPQTANMTTASVDIVVEIGQREGVYSVERTFVNVDKNNIFDTAETVGGISTWDTASPA